MDSTFRKNSFTAWLLRLKNVDRWPLMKSFVNENVATHCHETTIIAHVIAVIGKNIFEKKYDPNLIAIAAAYHESSEASLGDLPSPVKYYNAEITDAYKKIEGKVESELIATLPKELRQDIRPLIIQTEQPKEIKDIVKASDRIATLIKSMTEINFGNREFSRVPDTQYEEIRKYYELYPEVKYFMETQYPECSKTLDELTQLV